MTEKPKYRDEAWLREQYIEQERPQHDIAEECDCHQNTIRRWLEKHDIKTRSRGHHQITDSRLTNEGWLREQYVENQRSRGDIAGVCGCSEAAIKYWLEKHGIECRDDRKQAADDRLTDREWLYKKYVKDKNSTIEISNVLECDDSTVVRWLKIHGIDIRSRGKVVPDRRLENEKWVYEQYVRRKKSTIEISRICGCAASTAARWVERHGIELRGHAGALPDDRLNDPEWLVDQYKKKERTSSEIAKTLDCHRDTVCKYLKEHGIELREPKSYLPFDATGKDNPNWSGGRVPYGSGWNERKRQAVRVRDNHTCQDPRCSVTQAEHVDEHDEKLHVHHLRKARDVDDPEKRNAKENLITLCRGCHRRWEKIADAGLVPQISPEPAD